MLASGIIERVGIGGEIGSISLFLRSCSGLVICPEHPRRSAAAAAADNLISLQCGVPTLDNTLRSADVIRTDKANNASIATAVL